MKYRKFNRYEKKEIRKAAIAAALAGAGRYIFENSNQNAELTLPRPTKTGVRKVAAGDQFQGDDYYMQYVKTGELRLIEVLQTAEEEETLMNENKLILDQPDIVTETGKVEHVVASPKMPVTPVNETAAQPKPAPVLLNEGPVDDGFVIVDEG